MQFNERKAIEAAYEVVKISGGKTTIMRLVKLLYLIDRYALENWERTVTTDNHVSMPHGTVTSKIYNIHKNNKISNLWQKYLNSTSRIVSIKEELPIAKLSRREIDAIHKIVANYSDLATNQLRAITAYHRHKADCIVAEKNNGGEMVESVIRQAVINARMKDKTVGEVPVRLVWASRGKAIRAEPISAIAEKGRDHHVGTFEKLEDELCMWVPGEASPNRLDAKVWAMTYLSQTKTAINPKASIQNYAGQSRSTEKRPPF